MDSSFVKRKLLFPLLWLEFSDLREIDFLRRLFSDDWEISYTKSLYSYVVLVDLSNGFV